MNTPVTEAEVESALQAGSGSPAALASTKHYRVCMRRALEGFAAGRAAGVEPAVAPPEWPKTLFEKVAPGIEVGYDMFGGVDIRLGGEFVYVHINYDYRYTHNAARKKLADNIVRLLAEGWPSAPVERKPLSRTEVEVVILSIHTYSTDTYAEAVVRATEARHGIR